MTKKKRGILSLLILAVILVSIRVVWQKVLIPAKMKLEKEKAVVSEKESAPPAEVQGLPVKVFRTAKTDYQDIIAAMGNIKGDREVDMKFEVQGVLKSFNFLEGERIGKAEVVAELDPKDYLQRLKYAETKLKSTLAGLAAKKKEYEMYKRLYDIGAVIKLKLEQAALEYEQGRLEVEGKRREVEFARLEMDKTRFYAPDECVLGSRLIDIGELVLTNTKVGVLVDARIAIAEVGVIEREVKKLSIGQRAKLYVDAYPGEMFSGVIGSIQPMVAEKSRTVIVKISVDNPEERLLSGMFTRVEIVIFDKKGVIIIPTAAIQEIEDRLKVFIVEPRENKAKSREIDIDYVSDEYAEVISGLSPDDLVILNVDEVSDDMPVQVVEEEALGL
ncbi:MAG: efflux RND transporter periplasmic adaptor subunit [Candidatus Ratteibacteria bacterium]|nr:efflux RND transporter periplasmic adaptor subunit [Candidatus Ratteibacteria bacterium]